MLVLIIHKDKNRYYVNLSKKDNKNILSVICANSNETKCLTKEEASSLFNELLYSKLKYKEKENDYDVYLDENNNKRYFKGKIEDYKLLFQNNGVSAIKYKDGTYGEVKYTNSINEEYSSDYYCNIYNELYMSDIRHYSKEKIYVLSIADKFSDQNKVYVKKKRKIG